jgi:hypothetical protein
MIVSLSFLFEERRFLFSLIIEIVLEQWLLPRPGEAFLSSFLGTELKKVE